MHTRQVNFGGIPRIGTVPGVTAAQNPSPSPEDLKKVRRRKIAVYAGLLAALLLITLPSRAGTTVPRGESLPYSEAVALITQETPKEAWLEEGSNTLVLAAGETPQENVHTSYPEGVESELLAILTEAGVKTTVKAPASPSILPSLLFALLPVLLIIGFLVFMTRKSGGALGGAGNLFALGKSKTTPVDIPDTRFTDVAGVDTALDDLQEVVDFLHHPERYDKTGANRPRGFLLVGPPGTGKTLLARAVAGEAGVPFYAITGADFVELFAGLGASRVRDLFAKARTQEKAIIFIDEVDAVGKARGVGIHTGANDERENTLNALLVELDGFARNDGIVILAATNRPDVLDPALLRPGRFDRQIVVPAPDRGGRRKILELYAKKRPFATGVDWDALSRRTAGMTGAQLEQLTNEAALVAARSGSGEISAEHLESALQTTMLGRERRGAVVSERDRRIVAWHEAGHAVAALLIDEAADPVQVSIVPRGGAGGVTWMEGGEHDLLTRSQARAQLVVAMAGRAAEELLLDGDHTQGAHGDLEMSTGLATAMVARYGMGERMISRSDERLMMNGPVGQEVDREVAGIIENALASARALLVERRTLLEMVAGELLEEETLSLEDLKALRFKDELTGKA